MATARMRAPGGPARFAWGPPLTTAVKVLLVVNAAVFLVQHLLLPYFLHYGWGIPLGSVAPRLEAVFGLSRELLLRGFLWQPVTYLFLHANAVHLIFNLLALWMFGSSVEAAWGWRAFLRFYFLCGIAAGLAQVALFRGLTVGASGAIYGLLVAYAVLFPHRRLYVWGIVPVTARVLVTIVMVLEVAFLARRDNVAHLAHLAGALAGWLYLNRSIWMRGIGSGWRGRLRRRRFRPVPPPDPFRGLRDDDPRTWN